MNTIPNVLLTDIVRRVGKHGFRELGNVTANYVEGLRLAVQTGPSQRALDLIASATDEVMYAHFALGSFLICCGAFDQGMEVFFAFFRSVSTIEEAVGVAEMVIHQIADMGILPSGLYDNTLRFGGLPHCVLNNFSLLHLCPKCFAFHYARRIQAMC
ncbi:hypothetical protein ARALYDRAFT_893916 [Arabidopsis lyrata subsp. lyrata]|uniref:Uncharacterized protein n=1 Tax=Arabidopsis lyrata subsp. lyrata TaxID=81972 RepID=D7KQY6_ARALL|nr:hypothetical protein ARALYDRAFT_893916 [Arabidopsis lyrata subsp. lyrata]